MDHSFSYLLATSMAAYKISELWPHRNCMEHSYNEELTFLVIRHEGVAYLLWVTIATAFGYTHPASTLNALPKENKLKICMPARTRQRKGTPDYHVTQRWCITMEGLQWLLEHNLRMSKPTSCNLFCYRLIEVYRHFDWTMIDQQLESATASMTTVSTTNNVITPELKLGETYFKHPLGDGKFNVLIIRHNMTTYFLWTCIAGAFGYQHAASVIADLPDRYKRQCYIPNTVLQCNGLQNRLATRRWCVTLKGLCRLLKRKPRMKRSGPIRRSCRSLVTIYKHLNWLNMEQQATTQGHSPSIIKQLSTSIGLENA
jgi:hypothetical protein